MPRKLEPRAAEFKCREKGHIFRRQVPHGVQYAEEGGEPGPAAMANIPEVRCPECDSLSDLVAAPIGEQLFAHNNSQRDCTAF